MKQKLAYFILITVNTFSLFSQEKQSRNQYNNMIWAGYYNTLELSSKWSIATDIQLRTNNWQENLSQGLIRTGLNYKSNDRFNASIGVAYFNYFITNTTWRNEYRPWQEIGFNDKIWKLKVSHRYRLEERINQKVNNSLPIEDYSFNYRFRYKVDVRLPFKKETEKGNNIYMIAGNELMVNFGKEVKLNFFDQNRSSIGLHFEINQKLALQLQYVRIWQQTTNGMSINNINVLRFNLYHKIIL